MNGCFRACTLAVVTAMAGTAAAADLEREQPPPVDAPLGRDWAVQATPYLWASGIRGDISPFRRGPTIGVSKSFGEIFDELRFGGFLHAWGRTGHVVFSGDVMLVDTTERHAIERVPIFGPVRGVSADVDSRQFTATMQAGYRLIDAAPFTLDVLAGARVWSVSNKVTVNYGPFAISHREGFNWIDPIIGLRAFYGLSDRFSLHVQADVGGFGAGARSTWQVLATANYAFTDHLSASIGYKILKVDYSDGGHVFDATLQGPVAGLTYRF